MTDEQVSPEDEHPLVRKQEARNLALLLLRWRSYQTVSILAMIGGVIVAALNLPDFGGLLLVMGGVMFATVGIMRYSYERRLRKFVSRYHMTPREILGND